MPKPKTDLLERRKPSPVARRGGFSGARNTRAADQAAPENPSTPTPQVQNSPSAKRKRALRADVIIIGLAGEFPNCFVAYERRRRPLKIGICDDVIAASIGFDPDELKNALRRYTGSLGYLTAMSAGADRVDLDGNPAGIVTPEAAALAQLRIKKMTARGEAKAKIRVRRELDEAKAEAKSKRLSIDDLRTAARLRKQRGGSI